MSLDEQRAFQSHWTVEGGAAWQCPDRHDRCVGVLVEASLIENVRVLDDTDLVGFFFGLDPFAEVITVTPAAEVVIVLQAKADGVDARVAGAACRVAGMQLHLFPEAELSEICDFFGQHPGARRGWRGGGAKNSVEDIVSTFYGARIFVIGC